MAERLKSDSDQLTPTQERDINRAWFDAHHTELKAQYGPNAFVVIEKGRPTFVVTDPAQIDPLRKKLRKEGRADSAFWRTVGEKVLALTLPEAPLKSSAGIKHKIAATVEISANEASDLDDEDTTA